MQLKSLSYSSRARLDLDAQDISDIHETARHLNAIDGVTGLLVFDGIRFFQIFEGAQSAIDDLLERLLRDPRHSSLEVIDDRFVAARSFPGWSMELVQVKAGHIEARDEVMSILPDTVGPEIRRIAVRMAEEIAVSL